MDLVSVRVSVMTIDYFIQSRKVKIS